MYAALNDIVQSFKGLPKSLYFAWGDTRARYRRSLLGPLWIVLGTAIGVVGLGYLWSSLLKVDRAALIPSLSIGIVVWQLLTGSITESANIFIKNSIIIRNIPTTYFVFPIQLLLRQLITFAHNFLVIIMVLIIFPTEWTWVQLMFFPGMLIMVANLLWVALIIGMLGARFRDLDPLISAIMPMMFFLSPVIFRPEHLSVPSSILWLNPLTYLITIVRDPLQGVMPEPFVYFVAISIMLLGWLCAFWLLRQRGQRIAFWL